MKIYEKIKNAGKKFIAPAVLAVGLAFSGCDKNESYSPLPITQVTRNGLESERLKEYNAGILEAEKLFNESLADKKINYSEQKTVYNALKQPIYIADQIKKYSLEKQYPEIRISTSTRNLYDLVNENLHGLDTGKPNLQIELERQGYDMNVEQCSSDKEGLAFLYTIFSSISSMVILYKRMAQK